jgi:hypothetical protein
VESVHQTGLDAQIPVPRRVGRRPRPDVRRVLRQVGAGPGIGTAEYSEPETRRVTYGRRGLPCKPTGARDHGTPTHRQVRAAQVGHTVSTCSGPVQRRYWVAHGS